MTDGFSGIRVVVVAHGPPLRGGIATVAMDLVEDPELNACFEMVFLNTSQNEDQRGKFSLANIRRLLSDSWATFRLARRGAVVHTHSVQEPWPVAWRQVGIALAARARGASVVLHNHAAAPYMQPPGAYDPGRPNRWAFRVLDRLVAANIVLSSNGVPNMGRWFVRAELPVVGNSVVVSDVVPSSAVHDPPVVLFIGELLERKGLRTLLDALDLIDAGVDPPDYELRIVGNDQLGLDPAKDEMVREVAARGRSASMTGVVPRSEVYRHFSEADLYVLPTDYEGQPFALIEALAAGVPIVATAIPSIEGMIDDGIHGRLVQRNDTEGFATAIRELLEDPEQRRQVSAANRRRAEDRFDRHVFRDHVARLYRRHGRLRRGGRFGAGAPGRQRRRTPCRARPGPAALPSGFMDAFDAAGESPSWSATLRADLAANAGNTKGRFLVVSFRVAQRVRGRGRPPLWAAPLLVVYRVLIDWLMGVDLPPTVVAGPGLQIWHGTGLVVHANTTIGSDVILRHGTTIGARENHVGAPAPTLGDRVDVGAGALVLGPVTVGDDARIGAGSVVVRDVPAGVTVVGNPARILG